MLKGLAMLMLLLFIGPLILLITGSVALRGDYRTANRQSAHIAPEPTSTPEAIVQIYAARAFNWRGLFAVHTWIAVKAANATHYRVYQVIGWRVRAGLPAVVISEDLPDRYWFNSRPWITYEIRGATAAAAIPKIAQAAQNYPYPNNYRLWPGPNSNTFIAYMIRQVPELHSALPSNALGKDFLPEQNLGIVKAPSGSGYQLSIYGIAGVLLAQQEGLEINILGMVLGFNPKHRAIELPGIGRIGRV